MPWCIPVHPGSTSSCTFYIRCRTLPRFVNHGYQPGQGYRGAMPSRFIFRPRKTWNYLWGAASSLLPHSVKLANAMFSRDLYGYVQRQVAFSRQDRAFASAVSPQSSASSPVLRLPLPSNLTPSPIYYLKVGKSVADQILAALCHRQQHQALHMAMKSFNKCSRSPRRASVVFAATQPGLWLPTLVTS
ncbi:hypothetical protein N658DRAFT_501315 [Parathielavia hyrcaniae]|uniref:Uncharacterized protein n=1 Tax=Parathielavia hyrcaniae TaxID=113614 RepID=A0AAN6SXJ0_9PEZI|nr:hypothetical protein N658DRAFT_501315 [Parathielavia hyrcaniae]